MSKTQDAQTKGLPVGPDTSFLLAEIVLCAVDLILQKKHIRAGECGARFVDDLEFFARSRGEAEDVLFEWDQALSQYELSLNEAKTNIVEGPISLNKRWRIQLPKFVFNDTTDGTLANDIRAFFSLAFDLQREFPSDYVVAYAIARVQHMPTGRKSWCSALEMTLAAVIGNPSCLQAAAKLIRRAKKAGYPADANLLTVAMNEVCLYHSRFEHGSEVAWALWILRANGLNVAEDAARNVAQMQDNSSLLLLWNMADSGRVDGGMPDMSQAERRAKASDAPVSMDWLLAYEATRRGYIRGVAFRKEPAWRELLRLDVAFFRSASPADALHGESGESIGVY